MKSQADNTGCHFSKERAKWSLAVAKAWDKVCTAKQTHAVGQSDITKLINTRTKLDHSAMNTFDCIGSADIETAMSPYVYVKLATVFEIVDVI